MAACTRRLRCARDAGQGRARPRRGRAGREKGTARGPRAAVRCPRAPLSCAGALRPHHPRLWPRSQVPHASHAAAGGSSDGAHTAAAVAAAEVAAAAQGGGGGAAAAAAADASAQELAAMRLHGSGEPSTSSPGGGGGGSGARGPSPVPPAAAEAGASSSSGVSASRASSAIRVKKFHRLLSEPVVDLDALRELAWSGIPPELRPLCWRLLVGYLPPNRARQAQALARKRREYAEMVPEFYDIANSERSEDEIGALRQVGVGVGALGRGQGPGERGWCGGG
jgi:hypothetical protein